MTAATEGKVDAAALRQRLDELGRTIESHRKALAERGPPGSALEDHWDGLLAKYDTCRNALAAGGTNEQKRHLEMRADLDALAHSFEKWTADVDEYYARNKR